MFTSENHFKEEVLKFFKSLSDFELSVLTYSTNPKQICEILRDHEDEESFTDEKFNFIASLITVETLDTTFLYQKSSNLHNYYFEVISNDENKYRIYVGFQSYFTTDATYLDSNEFYEVFMKNSIREISISSKTVNVIE